MKAETGAPIAELLRALAKGDANLDSVGGALSRHEGMQLVMPNGEMARALEANEEPNVYAIHSKDGQNPLAFTHGKFAHECAVENGWIEPGAVASCLQMPWVKAIRKFLWRKDAGVIIDHGTEHRVYFDNLQMCQLYAAMTVEWTTTLEALHLMCVSKQMRVQQNPDGKRLAFAFDHQQCADRSLEEIRKNLPMIDVMKLSVKAAIEQVIDNNIDMLVVNYGIADERTYFRRHIDRMACCS